MRHVYAGGINHSFGPAQGPEQFLRDNDAVQNIVIQASSGARSTGATRACGQEAPRAIASYPFLGIEQLLRASWIDHCLPASPEQGDLQHLDNPRGLRAAPQRSTGKRMVISPREPASTPLIPHRFAALPPLGSLPAWARIVAQAPNEDLGPPRMPWVVQEGTERASWARAPLFLDLISNLDSNSGNVRGRNVAAHQNNQTLRRCISAHGAKSKRVQRTWYKWVRRERIHSHSD